jgi:hypothetical protein
MLQKARAKNLDHTSRVKSQALMEMLRLSARQRMKVITIVISLACFCQGAQADDQATPSPTPVYLNRLARPGSIRREEQINRSRRVRAVSELNAEARAQAKADRRSAATAQAQAREAARVREQAQREVAAQNRSEARNETPRPTSDLMSRMGFSEQEIAAQKTREHSETPGAKETSDATLQAGHKQEQLHPAADSGGAGDHATPSPAKANRAAAPRP